MKHTIARVRLLLALGVLVAVAAFGAGWSWDDMTGWSWDDATTQPTGDPPAAVVVSE
jgi:hypothetical protein